MVRSFNLRFCPLCAVHAAVTLHYQKKIFIKTSVGERRMRSSGGCCPLDHVNTRITTRQMISVDPGKLKQN